MAVIPIFDELPEKMPVLTKEDFKQRADGKYELDITPTEGVELANMEKINELLSGLRKKEKALEKFGEIDAKTARENAKRVKDLKDRDPDKEVEAKIEAIKSDLTQTFQTEKTELESRCERLSGALDRRTVSDELTKEIVAQGGSDALVPILAVLSPNVKMKEVSGTKENEVDYIAEVHDGKGNPRHGDSSGTPMTIAQLVAESKKNPQLKRCYDGTPQKGSGSPPKGAVTPNQGDPAKQISIRDQDGLNANLEDIAAGTIEVTGDL